MRRAIAAAVMSGLVLGEAMAAPSVVGVARAKADGLSTAGKPATGLKTVVYQGYEFQVPSSWPVYRLDEHPQTCVRYDVPAVYLGAPGANMRCPAGLVGRTQTVSFSPGAGAGTGPATGSSGGSAAPAAAGTEVQRLPAVHAAVTRNVAQRQLEVAVGAAKAGATVVGTYGSDPAVVDQVLSTLRPAPKGTAPTAQSASPAPLAPQRASAAPALSATSAATAAAPSASASPATAKSASSPPVSGFDACGAQPLSTMRAWRGVYAAVGVYIGGVNAACARGNLSASWVRAMTGMGWGLLPTYVGPQAPCWGSHGVLINPGTAVAQGKAAAADAVSDARAVGLTAGSPIYYDMEGYQGNASCRNAVLSFLGAWDRQVAAAGYVTCVYSSQVTGIADMQAAVASKTPGFTPPRAVWIAQWDDVSSLSAGKLAWPLNARAKQFAGNVNQTIGGVTLNIDKDLVGGPVAGGPVVGLPGASAR